MSKEIIWYRPCDKLPENERETFLGIISGKACGMIFNQAIEIIYYNKGKWYVEGYPGMNELEVHAWAYIPVPEEVHITEQEYLQRGRNE